MNPTLLGGLIESMVQHLFDGMSKVEAEITHNGIHFKVSVYKFGINYRIDLIPQ